MISVGPAGANGTMTRTGRVGKAAARARDIVPNAARDDPATSAALLVINSVITSSVGARSAAALSGLRQRITIGFSGEPTAPVIGKAGATNRNS